MNPNRFTIVFLIDTISCDTAGTQKQLLEVIRKIDRIRFVPLLVCLHSSPWLECASLPCPVKVLGYRGFFKWNFPSVVWRLRQIILQRPVDILQTFFEDSIFVAFIATRWLGKKRCLLLSSRRDMGLGTSQPWYHRLFALTLPFVSQHFDGIVCNGLAIRNWVARREQLSLEKIQVIPNGTTMPGPPGGPPELISRWPQALWIGVVASLTPVKRIDVFLKALKTVRAQRPDIDFQAVVLGEGPEREALLFQLKAAGLGSLVHFPGAVHNVGDYLHHLHIGVLCSDREGFSNAVLEYMAHCLPVVVTAVGGNSELVDEATGLCVPAGDVAALAQALIRLADDPELRGRLGAAGQHKVASEFSWERSMTELESYYSQLLAEKAAGD